MNSEVLEDTDDLNSLEEAAQTTTTTTLISNDQSKNLINKIKYNIICESDEDDFEKILNYEVANTNNNQSKNTDLISNSQIIITKVPSAYLPQPPAKQQQQQQQQQIIVQPTSATTSVPSTNDSAKKYFETDLATEASFSITKDDWTKLKSIQKGHRFLRGEWEDYFIMGMKESNKYCVFAFKDHYVNQCCIRSRRNKKYFSANGYCVFEDCNVKFSLKMSEECKVIVNYTGKLKHCVNEVHARYFRGKSRQELKEILKHTTPMREYLNRIQNADNEQIFAGNADFIGRSTAVYRRIASEAKDIYQALLLLRLQLIEKTKSVHVPGFIQLIQHIPGCIICFNEPQIKLFFNLGFKFTLFISSIDSIVNTTINGKSLYYYELCIQNPIEPFKMQPIPLTCMLTVSYDNELAIKNWLRMLLDAQYQAYHAFNTNNYPLIDNTNGYIICNNSYVLIKSLINELMGCSYISYLNNCYQLLEEDDTSFNSSYISDKFYLIHICSKQILNLIKKLCLINYEKINLKFGIYAFSIAINCKSLDELKQVLYSLFSILESKCLNKNVENLFNFLKDKLNLLQKNNNVLIDYDTFDDDDEIGGFTFNKLNINNDDYTANASSASATAANNFDIDDEIQLFYSYELAQLKQKSKFTQFVQNIYDQVKADISNNLDLTTATGVKILNPRYCPKLVESFISNLAYNIPLWTKIMHNHVTSNEFEMLNTESSYNKTDVFTLKQLNERFSLLKSLLAHEKDSLDIFLNRLFNENNELLNELFNNHTFRNSFIKYDIEINNSSNGNSNYLTNNILYSTSNTTSSGNNAANAVNDLIRLNNSRKKRKVEDGVKKTGKRKRNKKRNESDDNDEGEDDEEDEGEEEEEEEEEDDDDENENGDEEDEIIIERSSHILSNLFGVDLIKDDLDTLDNDYTYLSSNIIEFYLKLIEYKANLNENSQTYLYIYPIDFYASLKYGYGNSHNKSLFMRENLNINLFDYKILIIPIQKSEHWSLAFIDFVKQKITYYDSLLINDYDCLKYLTDFLDREYHKQTQTKFNFRNWKISNEKNIPKQNRNKDCGVFMLFYAKCLSFNQDIQNFNSKDIEAFRSQLKDEILQQIISQDQI